MRLRSWYLKPNKVKAWVKFIEFTVLIQFGGPAALHFYRGPNTRVCEFTDLCIIYQMFLLYYPLQRIFQRSVFNCLPCEMHQ